MKRAKLGTLLGNKTMQTNIYRLTIPFAPDSINKVITYGKKEGDIVVLKHKWQKIAHTVIESAINDYQLPIKFKGRVAFFFKLYFTTSRDRDGDNYEAMCKGIIDAFVQKKMIKDDSARYVDDDGRRLRVDHERPRVEIIIKEKITDEKLVGIGDYDYPAGELVGIEYEPRNN
jgi:Holliday junction resolvase RusA-like endonuclease